MSQDLFAVLLATLATLAAAGVLTYVVASSTDRVVRGVASLGLTEVPWWLLRAPRGRHVRPWRSSAPEPGFPRTFHGRAAVVHAEPDPDFAAEVEAFIATLSSQFVPDLKIRAAELLAHEENEDRTPTPARTDVGATEQWSPMAEVAAMRIPPIMHRTVPDDDEVRILAELAAIVDDLAEVPDWAVDWGKETDAYLKAAGLNVEAHKRWRAGVFDVPTGEWRMALLGHH